MKKKSDLKSMLKFMPIQDQAFYEKNGKLNKLNIHQDAFGVNSLFLC